MTEPLQLIRLPHLPDPLALPALQPMRRVRRGEPARPLAWEVAFDDAANRIVSIVRSHGPASVGFVVSGWLAAEGSYLFGKLARGLIGTPHIDSTSRLGSGSLEAGLVDHVPAARADELALARTIVVAGAHPAVTQPAVFAAMAAARAAGTRVVVIDPRRSATAEAADLHLQLLPGSDVVLFHAMLHVLLWEGLADPAFIRERTEGFAALRDRVREFTPAHAARTCGLAADDIVQAARWFGGNAPVLSLVGQGLNQSAAGVDRVGSLLNLHLATGQTGRPGAGARWLAGQPQTARAAGAAAEWLAGARSIADDAARAEVARCWGVPDLPPRGASVVRMFEAAADGAIKALWIAGANPAKSLPDQAMVRRALERAEFVIVQDVRADTATAAFADLQLPGRTPGRRPSADWRIVAEVARRIEQALPPRRTVDTEQRPMFASRLSLDDIRAEINSLAEREGAAPAGALPFADPAWRPTAEVRDARYPVSLISGRGALADGEPAIELHPQELARRRWRDGDIVRVASRRGELLLPVRASSSVLPAQAFVAGHCDPEALSGAGVNALTAATLCTRTQQPELKHAAVRLDKPVLPWALVAAAWLDEAEAAAAAARLRALVAGLPFASVWTLARREAQGRIALVLRAAHGSAAAPEVIAAVEQAMHLEAASVMRYADPHSGQRRALRLDAVGALQAFMLAGETSAAGWALAWLREGHSAPAYGRALLAARRQAPAAAAMPAVQRVDDDRAAA